MEMRGAGECGSPCLLSSGCQSTGTVGFFKTQELGGLSEGLCAWHPAWHPAWHGGTVFWMGVGRFP